MYKELFKPVVKVHFPNSQEAAAQSRLSLAVFHSALSSALLSPLLSRGFLCVVGKTAVGSPSLSSSRRNSTGLRPASSCPAAAREKHLQASCGHVAVSGLSLREGAGER